MPELSSVNISCDVGESFGIYRYGYDKEVMDYIASVNVACGFHAGDPVVMRETIQLACEKNLEIGAHPGLPDLIGFGRRFMNVSISEACDYVLYQIGALDAFTKRFGVSLRHVKFHGALQRMTAGDKNLAAALAECVNAYNKDLTLIAFAGSQLEAVCLVKGIRVAAEVLIDRGYDRTGNILPITKPGGVVRQPERILDQIKEIINQGRIKSIDDHFVNFDRIQTLGFHYGTTSLDLLEQIRSALSNSGVRVIPLNVLLS
jgi:UPF0271 protein